MFEDAGFDAGSFQDAGVIDSGQPDAGSTVDAGVDSGVPDTRAILYPSTDTHSPITDEIAAHLRAIAAKPRRERALSKIGDSQTVSTSFLNCFAGTNVDLATNAV